MKSLFVGGLILLVAVSVVAQKLNVKIVSHQDQETDYSYVVPGYSYSSSNASVNCIGADSNTNCNALGQTTTRTTPGQQVSYHVRGATLTLKLPDGRAAVVNCESKFAERMAGSRGNRRSCRVPVGDEIEAEFKGDKAKLAWPVSLDGKKMASETYKIVAVLGK